MLKIENSIDTLVLYSEYYDIINSLLDKLKIFFNTTSDNVTNHSNIFDIENLINKITLK